MKQNTLRFLPLLIIFFSVVGALSWFAKNQKDIKDIKPETVNPSDLESEDISNEASPTPTTSFFFSNEPTTIPTTFEDAPSNVEGLSLKGGAESDGPESEASGRTVLNESVTTTTTTRTCTPVYGMADTCEEHTVVDTGAESSLAYGLSAFTYLAGLVAFVKSKKN